MFGRSEATTAAERRNPRDRRADDRRAGDRRRSDVKTATIHITGDAIRASIEIASIDGTKQVKLVRASWRESASSVHCDQGRSELRTAFTKLVNDHRLVGAKLNVLLGSGYCVTLVLSGTNETVQRELQELCERSRNYLSLGPGPKSLSIASSAIDARHQHTLISVVSQSLLKFVAGLADELGLKLDVVESSQVALSRLVQASQPLDGAALVVQVDETSAEIGVTHGGRLLLDYRPGGSVSSSLVSDLVSQHLTRLRRFTARQHVSRGATIVHAYVVGTQAEAAQVSRDLQTDGLLTASVLMPPASLVGWDVSIGEASAEFAAIMGCVLGTAAGSDAREGPNLIDQVFDTKAPPVGRMVLARLAPIAASLVLAAGVSLLNWYEQSQLDIKRSEVASLASTVARVDSMRLDLLAASRESKQLALMAGSYPEPPKWGSIPTQVGRCMPDEVWLDSFIITDLVSVAISGGSFSESALYDFVGHLQHAPSFAEVALQGTSSSASTSGQATRYDLQLRLNKGVKATSPLASTNASESGS